MCAHLVEGLGIRDAEGLGTPCGLPSVAPWCLRDGLTRTHCLLLQPELA